MYGCFAKLLTRFSIQRQRASQLSERSEIIVCTWPIKRCQKIQKQNTRWFQIGGVNFAGIHLDQACSFGGLQLYHPWNRQWRPRFLWNSRRRHRNDKSMLHRRKSMVSRPDYWGSVKLQENDVWQQHQPWMPDKILCFLQYVHLACGRHPWLEENQNFQWHCDSRRRSLLHGSCGRN